MPEGDIITLVASEGDCHVTSFLATTCWFCSFYKDEVEEATPIGANF